MNDRIVAYCGLICSGCPAYVATQAGDQEGLERTAAQWREEFNEPSITAESIVCDGCLATDGGRLSAYCSVCELRACAIGRDLANCAYCTNYACEKLEGWFSRVPESQVVLDEIKQSLG
jgi:hypothetical protein